MKVNLNQVKPSPKPIRSTWDEAKMKELQWSLMEEGQVEPIGVHENSNGYMIVWGHRRVEAARRAGWEEIDAVVVPQDEVNNLIQAGIENLSSEDMSTKDKVEWYERLINLGLSQAEISRRSTVSIGTLSGWGTVGRENELRKIFDIEATSSRDDGGVKKIMDIQTVLGNDIEAKKAVAVKSVEDRLTQSQTREVAQAYRDAPTPEVKQAVLKAPVVSRDTSADILRRSIHRVEMDTGVKIAQERSDWEKERDERRDMQAWDFAVKEFLDATKLYAEIARKGAVLVKYGKYSPEAARFTIRKIDSLIDLLKTYREELEEIT